MGITITIERLETLRYQSYKVSNNHQHKNINTLNGMFLCHSSLSDSWTEYMQSFTITQATVTLSLQLPCSLGLRSRAKVRARVHVNVTIPPWKLQIMNNTYWAKYWRAFRHHYYPLPAEEFQQGNNSPSQVSLTGEHVQVVHMMDGWETGKGKTYLQSV